MEYKQITCDKDSAMSEGNLETKYCGEVVSDEVQLWNRKQVT